MLTLLLYIFIFRIRKFLIPFSNKVTTSVTILKLHHDTDHAILIDTDHALLFSNVTDVKFFCKISWKILAILWWVFITFANTAWKCFLKQFSCEINFVQATRMIYSKIVQNIGKGFSLSINDYYLATLSKKSTIWLLLVRDYLFKNVLDQTKQTQNERQVLIP